MKKATVHLTKTNSLLISASDPINAEFKHVKGSEFKYVLPCDENALEKIRAALPSTEWKVVVKKSAIIALRRFKGSPVSKRLSTTYPHTATALREYQTYGADFISMKQNVLLADHPGLGKTLQTIAGIISAGITGDILVLAPLSAATVTWPHEIEKWAPRDEIVLVRGTRTQRREALTRLKVKSKTERRWVVCNVDMCGIKADEDTGEKEHLYPELFFMDYAAKRKAYRQWSTIILDESHAYLVTKSRNFMKQTIIRRGLQALKVFPGGKKIAMSGTPFRGKLENIWGTLHWFDPVKYKYFWPWVKEFFETDSGYFGGRDIVGLIPGKQTAFYQELERYMLRRTKGEVAKDLPPKTYSGYPHPENRNVIGHWLDMKPKQTKAYTDMKRLALAHLESGTLEANAAIAIYTRLKQLASAYADVKPTVDSEGGLVMKVIPQLPSNKFDWFLEFIESLGITPGENPNSPDTQKVIATSQYTSLVDAFEKALKKKGYQVLKITGSISAKKRQEYCEIFQKDSGPCIMLLNTLAGGVSLTLDRADDLVILDETTIPDQQEQVEDRIHRVSRIHPVTIHYLRSKNTIEEQVAITAADRDLLQKGILDGERGVDFVKHLLQTS